MIRLILQCSFPPLDFCHYPNPAAFAHYHPILIILVYHDLEVDAFAFCVDNQKHTYISLYTPLRPYSTPRPPE